MELTIRYNHIFLDKSLHGHDLKVDVILVKFLDLLFDREFPVLRPFRQHHSNMSPLSSSAFLNDTSLDLITFLVSRSQIRHIGLPYQLRMTGSHSVLPDAPISCVLQVRFGRCFVFFQALEKRRLRYQAVWQRRDVVYIAKCNNVSVR